MIGLIGDFPYNAVVTVNRVILRDGYRVNDLQERVAGLCENVKTYHSDNGFVGGFVSLNSGEMLNEGSTIGQLIDNHLTHREALIMTFWRSFEEHEASHRSENFQPLFRKVLARINHQPVTDAGYSSVRTALKRSPTRCPGPARPTRAKLRWPHAQPTSVAPSDAN